MAEDIAPNTLTEVDPVADESVGNRPRYRKRRFRAYHAAAVLFVAAVGALLVYAFYPTLTGTDEDARPSVDRAAASAAHVETVTVTPRDFVVRAEATGYLAPWRVTEVSAETIGRVVERRVEEGRFVQTGSILVRLDDRDRLIELQEAEAELLATRAVYAVNTSRGIDNATVDTSTVGAARAQLLQVETPSSISIKSGQPSGTSFEPDGTSKVPASSRL